MDTMADDNLKMFFFCLNKLMVLDGKICIDVLLNINETKSQRIRTSDHMAIMNCPSFCLMLFSAFKGNGHLRYQ